MTTLPDTAAAIYRSILAEPDEDLHRLVYAEWLDENADTVECPKCNGTRRVVSGGLRTPTDWRKRRVRCPCGSGRVPDGKAALAEFIRVQVELARVEDHESNGDIDGGDCTICDLVVSIRRRESALLAEHEANWRRGERCGACSGLGWLIKTADVVSMSPAGRIRSDCLACHGTGWSGSLIASGNRRYLDGTRVELDQDWEHPVAFRRGFPHSAAAPMADIFQGGQVTEWAMRVVREWPVAEWEVSDCRPVPSNGRWWIGPGHPANRVMSEIAFLAIAEYRKDNSMQASRSAFDTEVAAAHYQARAVGQVVREAAGFGKQGEGR